MKKLEFFFKETYRRAYTTTIQSADFLKREVKSIRAKLIRKVILKRFQLKFYENYYIIRSRFLHVVP